MATKDFKNLNTSRVFSQLEKSTREHGKQTTATIQEQEERKKKRQTQGRKGCRLGRYNVAFSPENKDFIRVMSKIRGQTMTSFINDIIDEYRNEHEKIYKKAKDLTKEMESNK